MIRQTTIAAISAALRKSEMVSSGKAPNQRVWEGRPSQYRSVGKAAERAIATPLSQKARAKIRAVLTLSPSCEVARLRRVGMTDAANSATAQIARWRIR